MTDSIGIEISARDLTAQASRAVITNMSSMREAMEAVAKSNASVAQSASTATSALSGIGAGGALGAIAAVVLKGASATYEYGTSVQKSIGGLRNQANALGLSTDQLQAYISAYASAGYTQGQAGASTKKFQDAVASAAKGNADYIASLTALGVKLLDAQGKVRPFTDLVAESAYKLSNLQDGAQKLATLPSLPMMRKWPSGCRPLARPSA